MKFNKTGENCLICELTVTQWFCPLGLSARASLFKRNLIVTRQMLTSGSIISSSLFFSNMSCSIVHVATEHQSCCSLIQQLRLIRALRLVFSHPYFLFLLTISSTHRYPYCTSIECILQHAWKEAGDEWTWGRGCKQRHVTDGRCVLFKMLPVSC